MKLVVVSQNGCNPCTMVKNFLNGVEVEFTEFNINVDVAVEVAEETLTVEDLGIMSTPVTILFDEDGEEISRVAGFNPPQLEVLADQLK